MTSTENTLKSLKRINWFFIVLGLLEIFLLVFLTQNFLTMLYGLTTVIPAYIALNEKYIKWNYFVAAWTLIQFNPLTGIALAAFIIGDFLKSGADRSADSLDTILAIIAIIIFVLIVISAFVLAILLISKTSKYSKQIKVQLC